MAILNAIIARPDSATARLRVAVELFASRALEGPHLAHAFIAEPIGAEVDAARIVCRRQFGEVFEQLLQEGVKSGEFAAQPIEISAACIVGAFTEALVRPVTSTAQTGDKKKLIDAIAAFCVRAALSAGSASL